MNSLAVPEYQGPGANDAHLRMEISPRNNTKWVVPTQKTKTQLYVWSPGSRGEPDSTWKLPAERIRFPIVTPAAWLKGKITRAKRPGTFSMPGHLPQLSSISTHLGTKGSREQVNRCNYKVCKGLFKSIKCNKPAQLRVTGRIRSWFLPCYLSQGGNSPKDCEGSLCPSPITVVHQREGSMMSAHLLWTSERSYSMQVRLVGE